MSVAVILGSAWGEPALGGHTLRMEPISTRFGPVPLYRYAREGGEAWVLFRHGVPHQYLPNQIPYRAHATALKAVDCEALLVTSSVGVLDRHLPLDSLILMRDLLMLDNRLPDGSACTMFSEKSGDQGHLVLDEGLFSGALSAQVSAMAETLDFPPLPEAVFAYTMGPRNKTSAENKAWTRLGAQINSMTVGPEVVLANELEIPVAGVGVGHKYSVPGVRDRVDAGSIGESLEQGRALISDLAEAFLEQAEPVGFQNRIYRY